MNELWIFGAVVNNGILVPHLEAGAKLAETPDGSAVLVIRPDEWPDSDEAIDAIALEVRRTLIGIRDNARIRVTVQGDARLT